MNSRYSNWIAAEHSEYLANIHLLNVNNKNARKEDVKYV